MKFLTAIAITYLFLSCSSESEAAGKNDSQPSANEQNSAKKPELLKTANYKQLIGIWELKEERTNPSEKGKEPGRMNNGILFAFHENGKFMSSSMGKDYVEDAWGTMGSTVIVKEGEITTEKPDKIFEMQWEGGIWIYDLTTTEMVLKYSAMGANNENIYYYFQKIN